VIFDRLKLFVFD